MGLVQAYMHWPELIVHSHAHEYGPPETAVTHKGLVPSLIGHFSLGWGWCKHICIESELIVHSHSHSLTFDLFFFLPSSLLFRSLSLSRPFSQPLSIYFSLSRFCDYLYMQGKDEQWTRALEYVSLVSELNYMTQIVIMLYEDPTKVNYEDN